MQIRRDQKASGCLQRSFGCLRSVTVSYNTNVNNPSRSSPLTLEKNKGGVTCQLHPENLKKYAILVGKKYLKKIMYFLSAFEISIHREW